MILEEGFVWKEKITKVGGSLVLTLSPEIRQYLECTEEDILVLKADKGKHGKFIGFGVDRNEKTDAKEREGEKDRKSNKDDASPKRSSKPDE